MQAQARIAAQKQKDETEILRNEALAKIANLQVSGAIYVYYHCLLIPSTERITRGEGNDG